MCDDGSSLVLDDGLQLEDQVSGQLQDRLGVVALGHFWKSTYYIKNHLINYTIKDRFLNVVLIFTLNLYGFIGNIKFFLQKD